MKEFYTITKIISYYLKKNGKNIYYINKQNKQTIKIKHEYKIQT